MEFVRNLSAFRQYIQAVREDGDWLNDWLTHMTPSFAAMALEWGKALAAALGL